VKGIKTFFDLLVLPIAAMMKMRWNTMMNQVQLQLIVKGVTRKKIQFIFLLGEAMVVICELIHVIFLLFSLFSA